MAIFTIIFSLQRAASKPMTYIFAWNDNNTMRDVTARYCSELHIATRKVRVEDEWLDCVLAPYLEKRNSRPMIEGMEFITFY